MALRELLLIAIIAVLCCIALVRPRVGVYSYIWYAVMRPDLLAWCPDVYNFSMMLAIATFIGTLPYVHELGAIFQTPITRWFLLLQIPLLLSTVFAVNPSLSYERYIDYVKSMAVLLLVPVFVRTAADLKKLLLIVGLSVAVIGVKFGAFGILSGGVIFINGYGGQMSDNNLVALAIAIIVPLCWYGLSFTESKLLKAAMACALALCIAAVVMTNSRGGTLALGTVFLSIIARSQRKFVTVVFIVVAAAGAVYMVRDQYLARMSTIATYEDDASAYSRVEHARAAVRMWLDHPIIGVGFGGLNYAQLAGKYMGRENIHVVHNTYLQMLVDSGPLAFMIYIGLLYGTIIWLIVSARRIRKLLPGEEIVPLALQASLAAFAIGGTFYSSQRYDLPYIILMACASWYLIVRDGTFPVGQSEYDEVYPAVAEFA